MRTPTPFEEKVYQVLTQIPKGRVTTYGEIARYLKMPRSSRAVGGALNRNPFAPEIPCHRVVGSTGLLTGYAFGLNKKIELLESEGVFIHHGRVSLKKFGYTFSQ